MKSPFVSRETYESALAERQGYADRLIDALAEVKNKKRRIAELEAKLKAAEAAVVDSDTDESSEPIRSHLGIRQVVAKANNWARERATKAQLAAGKTA
jgi:hypothetical protein